MTESSRHRYAFFLSGAFAYGCYVLLALLLLPVYHLQLNPDAISYFGIANEYLHQLFRDAINGYWSPLYSWLLLPLLAAGIRGPLAARLLAIPIGAGVIFISDRLASRLNLSHDVRRAIRLALVVPVLALAFIVITPDLLATLLILLYLLLVCSPIYLRRRSGWIVAGCLGAAMYLAKAYAMWFFVGHFIAVHWVWFFRKDARPGQLIASILIGLAVFILAASPWVAALKYKYAYFALNTTGKYNHAIDASTPTSFPPIEQGLISPPTALAVSVWEDPTQIHLQDWSEFASRANFRHFLLLLARNAGDFLEEMSCYSVFLTAIAVVMGIVIVRTRMSDASMVLMLAVLIYPLGYLLRHVEQRFISAPAILLVLLGGYLIDRASEAYALPRIHRTIAIWTLCLSLLPNPIWNLVRYSGHEGRRLQQLGEYISAYVPPHANVASDADWFTSMYASYYAQLRYYGVPKPDSSGADFARDLQNHHVQYLLIWNNRLPSVLNNWRRLTPADAQSPTIYMAIR